MNHPAKHSNSAALERRLALRDLVLFNLVAILGISWVATAARGVFDLARVEESHSGLAARAETPRWRGAVDRRGARDLLAC